MSDYVRSFLCGLRYIFTWRHAKWCPLYRKSPETQKGEQP